MQEAGEPGLSAVTAQLYVDLNGDGLAEAWVADALTDFNGRYLFPNNPPGTYEVRVVTGSLPASYGPTFDYDGIVTPNRAALTLSAGVDNLNIDFGYRQNTSDQQGKIGDFVYLKTKTGTCWGTSYSNVGIANVALELWADTDGDGAGNYFLASTATNSSGYYGFSGLYAGAYEVRVDESTLPAGATAIYDYDGVATLNVARLMLGAGQTNLDIDFGYQLSTTTNTGKIGDFVWQKKKNTCGTGYTNVGLSGVKMELYRSGETAATATTTTNSSGYYYFTGLAAGSYVVKVATSTLPSGLAPYFDYDGVATKHEAKVTIAAGERNLDVDFGYEKACVPTGKIGDFVYLNKKQICGWGYTRQPLFGVMVELFVGKTTGWVSLGRKATDVNGTYLFTGLDAGSYKVCVDPKTLPANVTPYADLDGIGTAHQAMLTLNAGQARLDADFGYQQGSSTGCKPPPCGGDDDREPGCDGGKGGHDDGPGCDSGKGGGSSGGDGGQGGGGSGSGGSSPGSGGCNDSWKGGDTGSSGSWSPFRDWLNGWRDGRSGNCGW